MQKNIKNQNGQTLIETIVAIFMLTTALTAAVGLAIYALSITTNNAHQLIATNLAREGVEVIRAMRDSNWLAGDATGGIYDLQDCADLGTGQQCYPQAFRGPSYNMDEDGGFSSKRYKVQLNPAGNTWQLQGSAGQITQIRLYLTANGNYTHTSSGNVITPYARQIAISFDTAASGYTASNPLMRVRSTVAWEGRRCTVFPASGNINLDTFSTRCKITVEEQLTNWKDYK